VANSYLILYPKPVLEALLVKHPELVGLFWEALNSMDEGRVYGVGCISWSRVSWLMFRL
jgi:hypothetical protein